MRLEELPISFRLSLFNQVVCVLCMYDGLVFIGDARADDLGPSLLTRLLGSFVILCMVSCVHCPRGDMQHACAVPALSCFTKTLLCVELHCLAGGCKHTCGVF